VGTGDGKSPLGSVSKSPVGDLERKVPEKLTTLCKLYYNYRMWADALPDGSPAEYRWRPLRKFRNSIP